MKVSVLATTLAILMVGGLSLSAQAGPAGDSDSDGTFNVLDVCSSNAAAPAPNGCDTDVDGYGNQCDGDFDNNGSTNFVDFTTFGMAFGMSGPPCSIEEDMDGNGSVNFVDFTTFGMAFGMAPGPSGLSCAGETGCE